MDGGWQGPGQNAPPGMGDTDAKIRSSVRTLCLQWPAVADHILTFMEGVAFTSSSHGLPSREASSRVKSGVLRAVR